MFTIESVVNPVYLTADGEYIHVNVKFAEIPEVISFVATLHDPEPHGREIYHNAKDGLYGDVVPYKPQPETVKG